MKFSSTRDPERLVDFKQALFEGLAPDGGLYLPVTEPDLRSLFMRADSSWSFPRLAAEIMHGFFGDEFDSETCSQICEQAFPFVPVLTALRPGLFDMELYHGPSCAFKDFGASFLATMMEHYLKSDKQHAIILTATSGDTGSAVAQAFFGKENIDVVILYPSGRVSPSQELQLTTVGGNVHALEVDGSFDDCQRMVKEAFLDHELRERYPLSSANSINLGRLIPQSFYYAWAFAQLKEKTSGEIYFCVPSGNFGNLTAGVLAWRWGLPVSGFIAATNENDVVPQYLKNGIFTSRPSVSTPANAMDVGNPSNFERLQALFANDLLQMQAMLYPEVVKNVDILATMKRYDQDYSLQICPHTAVGVLASERFLAGGLDGAGIVINLSTAHPGKFSEIVLEASGRPANIPQRLAEYTRRQKMADKVGSSKQDLVNWLDQHLS